MKSVKVISLIFALILAVSSLVLPAAAADGTADTEESLLFEPASDASSVTDEAPAPEAEPEKVEVNAELSEELEAKANAPQTFDFGVTAAVSAVISLVGFAVSKKK